MRLCSFPVSPSPFPIHCSCRGLLWRRASGNLFPLLTPRFSAFAPNDMPGRRRRRRWAPAPDKRERDSTFAHSRGLACLAIERARLLLDTNRKRSSFTITQPNEKRVTSYSRIISFECRVAATSIAPSPCTAGEYFRRNSRDKSRSRGFSRFPLTRNVFISKLGEKCRRQ